MLNQEGNSWESSELSMFTCCQKVCDSENSEEEQRRSAEQEDKDQFASDATV